MSGLLISVIVAVYNIENYIEKCVISICNQTYRNLEIILVDDGSTDSSGEICDKLAGMDDRIKVIHQKNGGLVKCRKAGLQEAVGELIGFVDGDDYLEPDMYERMSLHMGQYHADLLHTGSIINGVKRIPKFVNIEITDANAEKYINQYVFDLNNEERILPSIWSKLFKRELIVKCYDRVPDECSMGEDMICLLYCMSGSLRLVSMEEAFYHYTYRPQSIMNHTTDDYYLKKINLITTIKKTVRELGTNNGISKEADMYFRQELLSGLRKNAKNKFSIQQFALRDVKRFENKKIILYGAGAVGQDYYAQLMRTGICHITLWVDKNYENCLFDECRVYSPEEIKQTPCDLVLTAVLDRCIAENIISEINQMGIPNEKIVWEKPVYLS